MKRKKKARRSAQAAPAPAKKKSFLDVLLGPDPRDFDDAEPPETPAPARTPAASPAAQPALQTAAADSTPKEKKGRAAKAEAAKEQDSSSGLKRGSRLKQMKLKYFFSVILIYIIVFLVLYGVTTIFLTIWPLHPYVNLIAVILLLAVSTFLTAHIANHEMQSRWLRSQA